MRFFLARAWLFLSVGFVCCGSANAEPNADLESLARNLLSNPNVALRTRSADEIGRLGEKGRPAARILCQAMLDKQQAVRVAASNALEKVHPDLHPHAVTLAVDNNFENHMRAVNAISSMERGEAAAPIILYHLCANTLEAKNLKSKERAIFSDSITRMLREDKELFDPKVGPSQYALTVAMNRLMDRKDERRLDQIRDRREQLPLLISADIRALAKLPGPDATTVRAIANVLTADAIHLRLEAIIAMGDIAAANPKVRGEVFSVLFGGLKDRSEDVRFATLSAFRGFSDYAPRITPTLKLMKATDPAEDVRQAATEVLKALEKE